MTIKEFTRHLDQEIPLAHAMPDDPVGIQVMPRNNQVTTVAVAYELNERVVEIAGDAGAELIITFHPLIYPHLKQITGANRVERTVIDLIDQRIGLYVLHTAFDAHPQGTSHLLAKELGCTDITPLIPHPEHHSAGMGALGRFASPSTIAELATNLRDVCNASVVRVSCPADGTLEGEVRKVAILGGSGMSFYDAALNSGADAYITADVRYHAFHAANDGVTILDPGHAESEAFVVSGMATLVKKVVDSLSKDISILEITESTNPVRYIV